MRRMMKNMLILLLITLYVGTAQAQDYSTQAHATIPLGKAEEHQQTYTVQRVIDGNTLELSNGERVRLIGVEAVAGQEATAFVREKVEGKEVHLEFDVQQKDKDDRLLAYVRYEVPHPVTDPPPFEYEGWTAPTALVYLNAEIIVAGHGVPKAKQPNVKYADLFEEVYQKAKKQ